MIYNDRKKSHLGDKTKFENWSMSYIGLKYSKLAFGDLWESIILKKIISSIFDRISTLLEKLLKYRFDKQKMRIWSFSTIFSL